MAGPRAEKVAVVEEVRDQLERADAAILTEYRGLKVGALASLRRALRDAGADYKIYKNTLVRRATAGTGRTVIDPLLEGPTGIAFVEADVAAVAKVLRDFARTNPALVVKGSLVGSELYDARTTTALADLPSRDVLLAQIAGAFAAPLRQFASLLEALPRNFAYGLSALVDQRIAGGEALPTASADAAEASASEVEAAPDAEAQAEAAPEAEAAPDAEAQAEAAPEAEAAPDAEAQAEATPEAEAEAAPEPEAEAEAAPEPEAEAEEAPEPEAPAAPEAEAEAAPQPAPEAEPQAE